LKKNLLKSVAQCYPCGQPGHYIDKRKLAVIINPSYFGRFLNLPIDKIDI